MVDYSLDMEYFVLNAFKYAFKRDYGVNFNFRWGRGGDPARIADADYFRFRGDNSRIGRAKFAIGYAMEIFISDIINNLYDNLSEKEEDYLISFEEKVINAKTYEELSKIFKEFDENVIEKYYNISNGEFELKK